jgi:hypothetical protein
VCATAGNAGKPYHLIGRVPVSAKFKSRIGLLALIFVVPLLMAPSAFAITLEVAKKCSALAEKAFPLRVPGNPAAGYLNGTGADYRNYFNQCVANGGTMGEQAPQQGIQNGTASPKQGSDANRQAPK